MSNSLVVALKKFGETLSDNSVDTSSKLRVLCTLNEVTLTLSELSESGVARDVSKLKRAPGELGKCARMLVVRWKQLLKEHLSEEKLPIPSISPQPPCVENRDTCLHNDSSLNEVKYQSKDDIENHVQPHYGEATQSRGCFNKENNCKLSKISQPCSSTSTKTVGDFSTTSTCNTPTVASPVNNSLSFHSSSTSSTPRPKVKQKRTSQEPLDSVDSTSGMSFMESLNLGSTDRAKRKKKMKQTIPQNCKNNDLANGETTVLGPPSAAFSAEILSSLNEVCDRPDAIRNSNLSAYSIGHHTAKVDDDDDDGNLKFKSKQVLWVPKSSRRSTNALVPRDRSDQESTELSSPPNLLTICQDVLQRNLHLVDHVGLIPYELISRCLAHATSDDLRRIEQCNPQYVGYTDELWQRHVQRDLRNARESQPKAGESWCAFYTRSIREQEKHLNQLITRSAIRVKEELKNRRTTLTTDVITPRQVQRRAARSLAAVTSNKLNNSRPSSSQPTASSEPIVPPFRPYNVSRPSSSSGNKLNSCSQARVVVSTSSFKSTTSGSSGGLLNKLRKQFKSGRIR